MHFCKKMAGATGLEPATTGSTVRNSNQLSYAPLYWSVKRQLFILFAVGLQAKKEQ